MINLDAWQKEVLEHKKEGTDILVMTVKQGHIAHNGTVDNLPTDERILLTNIVALAEKYGTNVIPLMVPATDPVYATAKAAIVRLTENLAESLV